MKLWEYLNKNVRVTVDNGKMFSAENQRLFDVLSHAERIGVFSNRFMLIHIPFAKLRHK